MNPRRRIRRLSHPDRPRAPAVPSAEVHHDRAVVAVRRHVARRLDQHAAGGSAASRGALLGALRYRKVDFDDERNVADVVAALSDASSRGGQGRPVAVYLALPSAAFASAVSALDGVGLPQGSRIVVEKPFGHDLESAKQLNRLLRHVAGVSGEQAVFRVDHALGMATVQNLLAARLANRVLEPLWNSAHIEQVEILWEETLALEGRAGYYDRTGRRPDPAGGVPGRLRRPFVSDGAVGRMRIEVAPAESGALLTFRPEGPGRHGGIRICRPNRLRTVAIGGIEVG